MIETAGKERLAGRHGQFPEQASHQASIERFAVHAGAVHERVALFLAIEKAFFVEMIEGGHDGGVSELPRRERPSHLSHRARGVTPERFQHGRSRVAESPQSGG